MTHDTKHLISVVMSFMPDDVPIETETVQHLAYMAKHTGACNVPYEFGWFDEMWPCSPALRGEIAKLVESDRNRPIAAALPILIDAPTDRKLFLALLAKLHYATTQHGLLIGQVMDAIEHEYGRWDDDFIIAEGYAIGRLSKHNLLVSQLGPINVGDPQKIMEQLKERRE